MSKLKVLIVSQEINPFLPKSEISVPSKKIPQGVQDLGKEVRLFMPKYGSINERRHQLHEVIRLSGMNLVINDTDHPLVIKVASVPGARMQTYFIDSDSYFKRKAVLTDNETQFEDNDERAMFFARGVMETVKKLGWKPDVIHCHGYFTSLVPLYVKKMYGNDPHYENAKVIYSCYENAFEGTWSEDLVKKLQLDGFSNTDLEVANTPDFVNLSKLAVDFSDGFVVGSDKSNPEVVKYAEGKGVEIMPFVDEDVNAKAYSEFYDKVAAEVLT